MEYLDVVDENNQLTEKKEERNIIHKKGIWHREVAVWIVNEKGYMLLQKRASNRINQPNKWEICAGHVDTGETVESAVIRELEEELGFKTTINDLEFISIEKKDDILPNGIKKFNFSYNYFIQTNMKIEDYKIQLEELSEIKYVTFDEFEKIVINKDPNVTFSKQPYMPRMVEELRKRI